MKSHCGDKTVVLSPQWHFIYWLDDIFILNQRPATVQAPVPYIYPYLIIVIPVGALAGKVLIQMSKVIVLKVILV